MKETEQTLLDQIKKDVAKENGFGKWADIVQNVPDDHEFKYWPIVCERYYQAKAKASCEATLSDLKREVRENSILLYDASARFALVEGLNTMIDKIKSNTTIV